MKSLHCSLCAIAALLAFAVSLPSAARPKIELPQRVVALDLGPGAQRGSITQRLHTGTLATNSELEFERYLRPGDRLQASTVLEAISDCKTTAIGRGYFVTWGTTYTDGEGETVGRQRFRILKFDPSSAGARS